MGAPQNMRVSVHAHPLKAVEPELFAPEDLLEARAGGGPSLLALEAPEPSPASGQTGHKWFSNWFGSHHEGPSENGTDSPLPQPPFVSLPLLHSCWLTQGEIATDAEAAGARLTPSALVEFNIQMWLTAEVAVQTLRVPTSITEQEEVQVEVTRLLVECYFDIVRANLQVSLHGLHATDQCVLLYGVSVCSSWIFSPASSEAPHVACYCRMRYPRRSCTSWCCVYSEASNSISSRTSTGVFEYPVSHPAASLRSWTTTHCGNRALG